MYSQCSHDARTNMAAAYQTVFGSAANDSSLSLTLVPPSLVNTTADIMEDDLMFSMEEEEGSLKRPPVQRSVPNKRASSLSDANASDDEDEEFICPILDEPVREICDYLKSRVYSRQLSNSLPKTNFVFKVSCCPGNTMQRA